MKKSLVFVICFLTFCSKQPTKDSLGHNETEGSPDSLQLELAKFKPSIPIHTVTKLDIPTFLDIYISFLENQILWLRDSASQEGVAVESEENLNSDAKNDLEEQGKQKADFFKKWGISYDTFDQFSLSHSQEIQDYLTTSHPEKQKVIENLERFLSSMQNSNPSQDDEYNYKEEKSIIDKTTEKEQNLEKDTTAHEEENSSSSTSPSTPLRDDSKSSSTSEGDSSL